MALIINGKKRTGFPWGLVITIASLVAIAAIAWFSGYAKPPKLKAQEKAEAYLISNLNEASSYERVEISTIKAENENWYIVVIKYRATNPFGAKMLMLATYKVNSDGSLEIGEHNIR